MRRRVPASVRIGDVRRSLRHWIDECEPGDSRCVARGLLSMLLTATPNDVIVVQRVTQPRSAQTTWGHWVIGLLGERARNSAVVLQLYAIWLGMKGGPDEQSISDHALQLEGVRRNFAELDDPNAIERWARQADYIEPPPPPGGESLERMGAALKELGDG